MKQYLSRSPNYDKYPHVTVQGYDSHVAEGWDAVVARLRNQLTVRAEAAARAGKTGQRQLLVIDTYHGVNHEELLAQLIEPLSPQLTLCTDQAKRSEAQILQMLERHITDDRVFGLMAHHQLEAFFDRDQLQALQQAIAAQPDGLVVVYGHGARLLGEGDLFVYADMARWEIQQRFRRGELGNWGADNAAQDLLRRYKRAFFIEWRVFDRHKVQQLPGADFLLDTNIPLQPKLVSGEALQAALSQVTQQPFRLVPFFDPGVWGGQWMKEVCDLERDAPNYAWCFDCVPEENSLALKFGAVTVEIPAQDLVLLRPEALLGERVYARFGAEFPIRFDLLDTMAGENLSLQVHPLTEYIQQQFGMHYTQDESYYLLDAEDDASVFLGTKTGTEPKQMMAELQAAQRGDKPFNDGRFINRFPAKKHDHFLIPAGTVHCSGANAMVLEISATPYIFTFKLWDWGRQGLDGLPRPVHLAHGEQVIRWQRDTHWVEQNLINAITPLASGEGWREERTGLHQSQFIETRRHWFSQPVTHQTDGQFQVLNLVEGAEAQVESPTGAFEPFIVHYAETFVIPAGVSEYRIRPCGLSEGQEIATIKAYVR